MIFTQENILLLGGELDEVIVYDIKNEKQLQTFKAHDIRFARCFEYLVAYAHIFTDPRGLSPKHIDTELVTGLKSDRSQIYLAIMSRPGVLGYYLWEFLVK